MSAVALPVRADQLITTDEFMTMDHDRPVELINGRIVEKPMTNEYDADVSAFISGELHIWNKQAKSGRVRDNDIGIRTKENTCRGADVIWISNEALARRSRRGKFLDVAPELVVEVVSPSNEWLEITRKIEEYFQIGVKEVWMVDPENYRVLIYDSFTSLRVVEWKIDQTLKSAILPGFELSLDVVFEWIADDRADSV